MNEHATGYDDLSAQISGERARRQEGKSQTNEGGCEGLFGRLCKMEYT